jgi:hypothetical protein
VQELPLGRVGVPLWRWRDPESSEDPADGGCADPVAELEEFALDALVSPAVVLSGKPLDERGDLGAHRWAFVGWNTETLDPTVIAMMHTWGRIGGVPYVGPETASP